MLQAFSKPPPSIGSAHTTLYLHLCNTSFYNLLHRERPPLMKDMSIFPPYKCVIVAQTIFTETVAYVFLVSFFTTSTGKHCRS